MPAKNPMSRLRQKVMVSSIGCSKGCSLALTRSCRPESFNSSISIRESMKAMVLISTDSAIRLRRSERVVAPNTFWVLMLLMRIGVSASEKFMKLMVAITTIRKEIHINR